MIAERVLCRLPEHRNGLRQGEDGRRKDDRHNASCVDLDRQVGGLAAVHLAAHNALGVLDRDAALRIGHEHDEHNDRQADDNHQQGGKDAGRAAAEQADHGLDQRRAAGNDTCEQDDRDTVADAVLGDVLAQPHDQRGACGEGQDDRSRCQRAVARQEALCAQQRVVREALEQAQDNRQIAGPGCDLLAAFLAAVLDHALKSGDGHGQQLQDNGRVDIRGDRHGEDRRARQAAASEHIQIAEHRTGYRSSLKVGCQQIGVDERNRDAGAEAEDQQDKQGIQDLLAQLRHMPGVFKGLKHLKSPRPFRLRLRSSPLQTPRKQLP